MAADRRNSPRMRWLTDLLLSLGPPLLHLPQVPLLVTLQPMLPPELVHALIQLGETMEEFRRKFRAQKDRVRYVQRLEERRAQVRGKVSPSPYIILGTFSQSSSILGWKFGGAIVEQGYKEGEHFRYTQNMQKLQYRSHLLWKAKFHNENTLASKTGNPLFWCFPKPKFCL